MEDARTGATSGTDTSSTSVSLSVCPRLMERRTIGSSGGEERAGTDLGRQQEGFAVKRWGKQASRRKTAHQALREASDFTGTGAATGPDAAKATGSTAVKGASTFLDGRQGIYYTIIFFVYIYQL